MSADDAAVWFWTTSSDEEFESKRSPNSHVTGWPVRSYECGVKQSADFLRRLRVHSAEVAKHPERLN